MNLVILIVIIHWNRYKMTYKYKKSWIFFLHFKQKFLCLCLEWGANFRRLWILEFHIWWRLALFFDTRRLRIKIKFIFPIKLGMQKHTCLLAAWLPNFEFVFKIRNFNKSKFLMRLNKETKTMLLNKKIAIFLFI